MAFDQSKDSSSIVSEERVEHRETDGDRWVQDIVRSYGNYLLIASVFSMKQETAPSAESK